MPPVQEKALQLRAARMGRRIEYSAKAACAGCGGQAFEIAIYGTGDIEAFCLTKGCRKIWPPIGKGQRIIDRISEAVGEGRDEPADLVSAPSREKVQSYRDLIEELRKQGE